MATYYIAPESPGTWTGTPRQASNQYIQDEIDLHSAGQTYVLQSGVHRGQDFELQSGDTLILAEGAILCGAEDVGTGGWTDDGSNVWYKTVVNGDYQSSGAVDAASGYDPKSLEMMVIDEVLKAWYTSYPPDPDGCYASGNTVYIYSEGNPSSVYDKIEITRDGQVYGDGIAGVRGESHSERAKIYGYASDDGSVLLDAAFCVGGTVSTPAICRNLDIFSNSGMGLGSLDYAEYYNVSVHDNGQLGVCGNTVSSGTDVTMGEGCHVYNNGTGGWDNSWEGGNSKFAWMNYVIIYGNLWDVGTLSVPVLSPLWLDANVDGYLIYSNVIRDLNHKGSRGVFLEIVYSGKCYNNILEELAWDGYAGPLSWGDSWCGAIYADGTGCDGATEYDTVEMYGNLAYKCAGGFGGVMNRGDYDDGNQQFGYWISADWDIHDNTTYSDGTEASDYPYTYPVWTGCREPGSLDPGAEPHNMSWDDNIYIHPSASDRFDDMQDGGDGPDLSWSEWNAAGMDTGSRSKYIIGSGYDPYPFNGGAM